MRIIKLLLFIVILSNCKENRQKTYYSNGKIKQIFYNQYFDSKSFEETFDTLGRITGQYIYENEIRNGNYSEYKYQNDYNVISEGIYINGEKFLLKQKYFRINDNSLRTEVFFQRIDTLDCPSIYKRYDSIGNIIDKESCVYEIHISNDTIILGEKLEVLCKTKCLDFKKMWIIYGDFDSIYRREGKHFDTLKSDKNEIRFNYYPKKRGENVLRGYILNLKPYTEDGEIYMDAVPNYFSKNFLVK